MSNTIEEVTRTPKPERRRRRTAVLWASASFAAALLVLAVNGTLSSWTTAIIDNTNNDVAVTGSVALVETDGTHTCDTGTEPDNQVDCSSINKYGGTATPLDPDRTIDGDSQTASVNLLNSGTVAGDLVLTSDACVSSGADSATYPVCTQVTVAVQCTSPSTVDTSPVALSAFTGVTVGTLGAGEATDCTFTLAVPASTPSAYAGQVASQVLHWTLTATS